MKSQMSLKPCNYEKEMSLIQERKTVLVNLLTDVPNICEEAT